MQAGVNLVASTASSTTNSGSTPSTLNLSKQLNIASKFPNNAVKNSSTEKSKESPFMRLQVPDNSYDSKPVGNHSTPKRPKRTSSSSSVISNSRVVARSSPRFYKGCKKRSPLAESNVNIG
jgi:hypothetical protein